MTRLLVGFVVGVCSTLVFAALVVASAADDIEDAS